jgi:hypothetical protein
MGNNFKIITKQGLNGYKKIKLMSNDMVLSEIDSMGKLDLTPLTEFVGEKIQIIIPRGKPIICTICKDTSTGAITYT